ncbi:MAG: chemotaxis protein CheW [Clostridiales bacterium]|nr:chemotaxis protein CheW [Clostridiales bacterium]
MADYSLETTAEKETKQYIVVQIGNERYGIDIGYIDNIVRMQKITRVPKAQVYFPGIINLRGEVVPVMSVRTKMELDPDVYTNASRIIILKIEEKGMLGIIVDAVCEVVTLSREDVEPNNISSAHAKDNFINGIGKNGEQLISLLDINAFIEDDNK